MKGPKSGNERKTTPGLPRGDPVRGKAKKALPGPTGPGRYGTGTRHSILLDLRSFTQLLVCCVVRRTAELSAYIAEDQMRPGQGISIGLLAPSRDKSRSSVS